jgi:hypothetical protein
METISISLIREQFADVALLGLAFYATSYSINSNVYTKFAYKYKWWKKQRDTSHDWRKG